jgi:hypothetical protein
MRSPMAAGVPSTQRPPKGHRTRSGWRFSAATGAGAESRTVGLGPGDGRGDAHGGVEGAASHNAVCQAAVYPSWRLMNGVIRVFALAMVVVRVPSTAVSPPGTGRMVTPSAGPNGTMSGVRWTAR